MALHTLTPSPSPAPTPSSAPNCVEPSASRVAPDTPCCVPRTAVDVPVFGGVPPVAPDPTDIGGALRQAMVGEDGSVATEYGLLAVVAATIVAVVLEWATSGGITGLLESVLARVAQLVGL